MDDAAKSQEADRIGKAQERRQFREDVALDFAAFDSSIARIQFLLTSNERERERYAAEKVKILEASHAVRASTTQLHEHLTGARRTLELRKGWDDLSEKITGNRMLRPREDQQANLERLQAEIAELERESQDYAQTWAERREQFGRIIKEGMELRRLIRDEKEEVERREGMEDREEGEEGEVGTPTPAGSMVAASPLPPDAGGATPMDLGTVHLGRGPSATASPSAGYLRSIPDASSVRGQTPHFEMPRQERDDDDDEGVEMKDDKQEENDDGGEEKEDEGVLEEGEDTTMEEQGEIVEDENDKDNEDEDDEDGDENEARAKNGAKEVSRTGSTRLSVAPDTSTDSDEADDDEDDSGATSSASDTVETEDGMDTT